MSFRSFLWYKSFDLSKLSRRVAKEEDGRGGREGGGHPPARLKKVKFALNIKHTLFDAML